jgi:pyridoxamine 5'-phosphate oxidase-like protein
MPVPSRHAPPLGEEIAELIASGVDIYVATRDATLTPESMLAMGAKVHADGYGMTVYLPEALSAATVANLRDNGQIAICLSRPRDHESVQVKGTLIGIRPSEATDRELQAVHRGALIEQFACVGIPRSATRRLVWWPSLAVHVQVDAVFQQTPGPRAGQLLTRA